MKSVFAASPTAISDTRATSSLRTALAVLGCCLTFLGVVHRATVASLWENWSLDPLGHGYFVVPAVVFLIYQRRASLVSLNAHPALPGLPFLVLLSFGWLLGNLTNTLLIQQCCLVLMCAVLVWIVLGTAAVRALLFPLGLLVFAPPLGDRIAPALQNLTALAVLKLLALSDVHPILEGHVISIDGNRWRVTEGCGGINYFVASLLVGYVYAGLVYRQWGHRLAFLGAAALVPLAANGVRVYTTILLDHYGASRLVSGMEHYLYGLLIFAIVMAVLFVTCGRWREDLPSPSGAPPRTALAAAPAGTGKTVLCGAMAILVVAMAPVSAGVLSQRSDAGRTIRHYAAEVSMPWHADGNLPEWSDSFAALLAEMRQTPPASEVHQGYTDGSRSAALYMARFGATQPGVKLVNRVRLPPPWWSAGETRRTIELAGNSFQVKEQLLRSPEWSLVVWSCYQIGRSFTANDYAAKLLLGKSRLLRDGEDAATIVIATEELPGVDATAILHGFVGHLSISQTASETGLEPAPIGLSVLQRSFLSSPSRPANGR